MTRYVPILNRVERSTREEEHAHARSSVLSCGMLMGVCVCTHQDTSFSTTICVEDGLYDISMVAQPSGYAWYKGG